MPCVLVRMSGEMLAMNIAARRRLELSDEGDQPELSEIFDTEYAQFPLSLEKAAGTSAWQTAVIRLSHGSLSGLRQQVRMHGMMVADEPDPVVAIYFSDTENRAFREHTALIRKLNRELKHQHELAEKLENLAGRETYLRSELSHRIKNNLAILSAIVRESIRHQTSEEAREALNAINLRIQSIGLVHGLLDRTKSVDVVEAHDLIVELCELMNKSLLPETVTLKCNVDSLKLHNEDATALCLLINEIVTNALKHAFGPDQKGQIDLDFLQNGVDKMELRVRDDGRGFTDGVVPVGSGGQGSGIIQALAQQLNGDLTHHGSDGTEWRLVFPPRDLPELAAE